MIQAGFSSPAPGSSVDTTLTVTGFVFDDGDKGSFPGDAQFVIAHLFVRFGTNGSGVDAQQDQAGHWSATGSLPPGTSHGEAVTVTLTCDGLVVSDDNPGENSTFEVTATLQVVADQTPPRLVVNASGNDQFDGGSVRVSAPPSATPPVTPLDLKFTPTFSHRNWHNNVDRIVAAGPNGFNVRFDAIDSDLRQAATVVDLINTALNQTGAIGQQVFTPGLEFVPLAFPGSGGWRYDEVGAIHPDGGSGGGFAVMGLTLPEQATLISFRAIGHWPGGHDLGIGLFRSPLTDATKSEKLAGITESTPGMSNPFDLTVPVTAALAAVDPGKFRYYVLAQAGFVADPSAISLSTIQLVYISA
jgi:hypothetical protein